MRVARSLLFLAVLTAVSACGGGGTEPTPPRDTSPLTVELTTPSALVFLDRHVPVQAFVLRALDTAGRVVDGGIFHVLSAPAGFSLRGDTLVAPHAEAAGMLRVTATRPQALGARAAVPLAAGDSTATDSLVVTAALDLRTLTWRARWVCVGGPSTIIWPDHPDSMVYEGVVSAWQYSGDSAYLANYDGVAQALLEGSLTVWAHDTVAQRDTLSGYHPPFSVWRQAPDTLVYYNPSIGQPPASAPRDRSDTTIHRYVGGNWCSHGLETPNPAPVLEEIPPAP